jgi:hypothetical protein
MTLGHSRKHPYHLHRAGNWKLTPLPPSDVLIHLLAIIRNNSVSPPPPDGRNFLRGGSVDLFWNYPLLLCGSGQSQILWLSTRQNPCLHVLKITDFVKKICNNKGGNIQIDETKRSAIMSVQSIISRRPYHHFAWLMAGGRPLYWSLNVIKRLG